MYRPTGSLNEAIMVVGNHERVSDLNDLNMLEEDETPVIKDHLEIY